MRRGDVKRGLSARIGVWVGVVGLGLAIAGESAADWEVYVAGGLGISSEEIEVNGRRSGAELGGQSHDTSALLDGAVGLAIPMSELVPREWLLDIRLPDWPVRFELEAAGLREHEQETFVLSDPYFTTIEATTAFFNAWLDVPMTDLYRPVQYLFGLGRQPRIRQWLEPASFYSGVGVGYANIEIEGTANSVEGDAGFHEFAWNAGFGVNYALSERVDLSAGYRFLCLAGKQCMAHDEGLDVGLTGGTAAAGDRDLRHEIMAHELRVQVRVEVYEFPSPWR